MGLGLLKAMEVHAHAMCNQHSVAYQAIEIATPLINTTTGRHIIKRNICHTQGVRSDYIESCEQTVPNTSSSSHCSAHSHQSQHPQSKFSQQISVHWLQPSQQQSHDCSQACKVEHES